MQAVEVLPTIALEQRKTNLQEVSHSNGSTTAKRERNHMPEQFCRSCGRAIIWAKTESGKAMPIDAIAYADGNICLKDGIAYVVPKDTAACVNAKQHRKPKIQRGKLVEEDRSAHVPDVRGFDARVGMPMPRTLHQRIPGARHRGSIEVSGRPGRYEPGMDQG